MEQHFQPPPPPENLLHDNDEEGGGEGAYRWNFPNNLVYSTT